MTIEIYSRSFVISILNPAEETCLHIDCLESNLGGLEQFLRFDALGFKNLQGSDDFTLNSHKVISKEGVLEAKQGKIFYQIVDGKVGFNPLNGCLGEYGFTVSLDKLVGLLARETRQGRWDDYCMGAIEHAGKKFYLYTHLLFNDMITVTDRESFYVELRNKESNWSVKDSYITSVMIDRLPPDLALKPNEYWQVARGACNLTVELLQAHKLNSITDIKDHFNIA